MRLSRTLPAALLFPALAVLAQGAPASNPPLGKNLLTFTVGAEVIPSTTFTPVSTPLTAPVASRVITQSTSYELDLDYGRQLHAARRAALWLDVPAVVGPSHRTQNGYGFLPTSLATFYVTPSLRVSFPTRSRFEPWLSAGGGYGLFETSDFFSNGQNNPTIHTHTGVLQFGGGVDVTLPLHVFVPIGLRTEFRDFYSLSTPTVPVALGSSTQHGITAGGGLTARF